MSTADAALHGAAGFRLPKMPAWLMICGCTLLVGLVFLTDEHRWDRSGLKDYVESAEERASAAVQGNNMRRLAFLALGGSGVVLLILNGRLPVLREPMGLCLLLATVWTFGSIVWADDFSFTLKRLLLITLCCGGITGLASTLTLRQLSLLLVCVSGGYLVLGVVAELLQGNFRPWAGGYRFAGTLHPNAQSTNCGALAIASYSLWHDREPDDSQKRRFRIGVRQIMGCVFCASIAFLVLTKSRTATAAVILTVGLIWATGQRLASNLIVAGSGLLLLLLLSWFLLVTGAGSSVGSAASMGRADSQGALNGRLPIWNICLRRIGSQLPIGYGYDGFWTGERIESVSWELGWSISSAHSEYIEIILGLGLIGLGLYLLVQAAGILWFWLRYYRLQRGGDAMILGLLLVGSVQGFMETGYLHPSALTPFVALTGMTRLAFFTDMQTTWKGVV